MHISGFRTELHINVPDITFKTLNLNHCFLTELPEAYVWTAGYDFLRDEGIMYAEKMRQDGVEVTRVHNPRAMHGCFSFPLESSKQIRKEVCKFIKEKLA